MGFIKELRCKDRPLAFNWHGKYEWHKDLMNIVETKKCVAWKSLD